MTRHLAWRGCQQAALLSVSVSLVLCLAGPVTAREPDLCINEVMALNATTLPDIDGDYSDWIELFNADPAALSLSGFGLSDDPAEPFKWVFPHVPLLPDSFLLVFASGKDLTIWPGELHTNFAVSADGEELLLTTPDGRTLDVFEPVPMEADVSYGRVPDGGPEWWYFIEATPGASNGNEPPMERAPSPVFSPGAGFYPPGAVLTMTCPAPVATIYFTLGGYAPTDTSILYTNPIILDTTSVVRAVSCVPGMYPSHQTTASYIVDFQSTLPVVSIITDPANLWDEETGIYVEGPNAEPEPPHYGANYWQDWEIPVHTELLELDGDLGVAQYAGAKMHGGWPRCFPQKSLRITARDQYGPDRLEYMLFPDEPIHSFKSVILRNSGNDWWFSMIRDAMMTGLLTDFGLGTQAYRPTVVFLNGAYWGIHNLRERLDEHYLASHYGVDKDNVDIVENHLWPNEGDMETHEELMSFVRDNDMSDPAVYDSVKSIMDVENFVFYQGAEIFFANADWPWNNIRCWRPREDQARWQWLLYDTDLSFGLIGTFDQNTLEEAMSPHGENPQATLLLRTLVQNSDFRDLFVVHFCDLMNTVLQTEFLLERIEEMKNGISAEMPRHEARWYPEHDWEYELEIMRTFASLRPSYVVDHLRAKFDLGEMATISVDLTGEPGGRLRMNSILLEDLPWQGQYFEGLPLALHAEPFTGYEFVGWEGDVPFPSESLFIVLENDMEVLARFELSSEIQPGIVVTEINYHSTDTFDPGDWIELYALEQSDLSGWILQDEEYIHQYIIPQGTVLSQYACLVLVSDYQAFHSLFPGVSPVLGDIGFNFGNDGDQVRLYDPSGVLVDSVAYDDSPPWPPQADGYGPTLQLIDPRYPNELPENWRASLELYGDPGVGYPPALRLNIEANDVEHLLSWTRWPHAHEYWIYGRSGNPELEPAVMSPFRHRLAVVPSWVVRWSNRSIKSSPDGEQTYLVLAVDDFGHELTRSNRSGVRHFALPIQ